MCIAHYFDGKMQRKGHDKQRKGHDKQRKGHDKQVKPINQVLL